MPDQPSSDDRWESLESFRQGRAGTDFDILCRFAQPIFDLFGFDPASNGTSLTDDEVEDHVAALETARLMWAYFESGGHGDLDQTVRLQAVLFGHDCSLEEQAAMVALIERLSANWETLPQRIRRSKSGHSSFARLLSELEGEASDFEAGAPATNGRAHGDHPVDSPEALAAFASPLLDDPTIDDDPDRISEMMARAQDYWILATMTGKDFVQEIERLADKYSTNADEKSAILAEANIMVARFHKLFPHWT